MKLAVTGPATADDPTPSASDIETALADHQRSFSVVESGAADLLVAVGVDGLRAAGETAASSPILSVGLDAACSLSTSDPATVADAVARVAAESVDAVPAVTHRPLQLAAGESTAMAVADCMLLTTQPARISEYAVTTGETPLTEFRADGVVVATPIGSGSYARAAGGPRLAPGSGVAVVPIAPFATQADSWVVQPPLTLTVERDTDVTVFADDRRLTSGGTEISVTVTQGSPLSVVDARRIGDGSSNWKNSNESLSED
jgi:NAD+ kinase